MADQQDGPYTGYGRRIVPAVGALILDDEGRVLLVKHIPQKGGFWAGKYIAPGGRLEVGEELEEGVRREVREETGLEIDIIRWLPPSERIVRGPDGSVWLHVIYLDVLARSRGGRFRPGSDVGEGRWFTRQELAEALPQLHEDTVHLLSQAGLLP